MAGVLVLLVSFVNGKELVALQENSLNDNGHTTLLDLTAKVLWSVLRPFASWWPLNYIVHVRSWKDTNAGILNVHFWFSTSFIKIKIILFDMDNSIRDCISSLFLLSKRYWLPYNGISLQVTEEQSLFCSSSFLGTTLFVVYICLQHFNQTASTALTHFKGKRSAVAIRRGFIFRYILSQ